MGNVLCSGNLPAWLRKVSGSYKVVALVTFNTLLAVLLLNLALAILFYFRGSDPARHDPRFHPAKVYPEASLAKVYPDFSREERNQMLRENWSRTYMYEDYVLFKERPYHGRYVNVSPASFRAVQDQGPWPPEGTNLNVFVFGGSTTFGYGLPDHQTIPSFLQESLRSRLGKSAAVYNFGTGYYNSTQERIFFERLLSSGQRPDIVIFIDGLNDVLQGDHAPFRDQFQTVFDLNNNERLLAAFVHQTPVGRFLRGVKRRLQKLDRAAMGNLEAEAVRSLGRYVVNKDLIEAICQRFGIQPVFVWQPVPAYKYDLKLHLFGMAAYHPEGFGYKKQAFAYREMAKMIAQNAPANNFLWCADLQEDERECIYVDGHHYTAKFARKLAATIVEIMDARGLLPAHKPAS